MVAPSLWLLTSVLIMTFGHFGHKSCHRSCSQVTFYLPKSINSQCSSSKSNCLMEAMISVDPTEDSFERVNITLTQLIAGDYLRDHTMFLTLTFPGHHRLPSTLSSNNFNSIGSTNDINNNPLSANGYLNNGNPIVSNGFPPYVRENNRFYNGDLSSSSSSSSSSSPSSSSSSSSSPSSSNPYLNGFSSNNNNRYNYPGNSPSASGHHHSHLETTTIISYSCRLLATGNAIAEIIQGHGLKYSYVSNSSRSCSFVFNRYDYLWPTLTTHHKVDLINNGDFTITIGYDDVTKDLRPESLPLHKMAYLRCCHRHHGGSKYLVIIEPSTTPIIPYITSSYYPTSSQSIGLRRRPSMDFYLQAYSPIPRTIILELTGPSEQSLRVNVSNSYFNVSILTDGEWISVLNNLTLPKIPRRSDPFDDFRLNWTLPVTLETPRGSIVIEEGQYILDIESDVSYGHREKVYITGKANLINSPSYIITLLLPIIFCTIFSSIKLT